MRYLYSVYADAGIVVFCIGSGGPAELAHVPGNVEGLVHLGYPVYFATIIGFWKVVSHCHIGTGVPEAQRMGVCRHFL
jgi:hypothetical protein